MFQLGSLVVLCSLLTGTSASLLGNIGSALNNLDFLNSPSCNVLQNLNLDVGLLQETMDWSLVKNNILEALNTLDPDRLNLLSSQNGLGGCSEDKRVMRRGANASRMNDKRELMDFGRLRINKLSLLNLQAGLSSNGNGIDLKLPLIFEIEPLTGFMFHVAISFDLLTPLTIETNAQTGLPTLSVGKCSSDADSFMTSLVGRRSTLVNRILDSVSGLLTNTVTSLLQNQICPLLQFLLSNLNVNLTQDLLSNLLTGQLPVSI
ncbi:BPI fold-containing family A member 2-like [Peromyscus leucopus]|uniref:BPI fold-containing family A member 2-like n=1 Tax=Peromyscus leucopus TaxID=10041 RepID=UPI0018852480|nr:BPI fold-containing family A member 2-like [Peromyscus leucopus]